MCFRVTILCLGVVLLAGCGRNESAVSDGTAAHPDAVATANGASAAAEPVQSEAANPTAENAGAAGADVSLRIAGWEDVEAYVAQQRGKVVVVDLWATHCAPCVREFPNLVALAKKYPEKVAAVSVSLDYQGFEKEPPESYRDDVVGFLREQQATFQNFLSSDDPDRLYERLELASIPAVYVYGRDGKLKRRFDNEEGLYGEEFTYEEHILPFIEELLNAQ